MGSMVGHVGPGLCFLVIGFWHLLNHIKLHCQNPKTYTSPSFFPTSAHRYAELFLIMASSTTSIMMELFVGPRKHQPLDPDGTIPTTHLHNFEHSNISLTFFMYALFTLFLDKARPAARHGLTQTLLAIAFGQEFMLFHLHSTDHTGVEGQYHVHLQILIFVALVSTLFVIGYPRSFVVSFIRSLSIFFQGVWMFMLGIMVWTPAFTPKGCELIWHEAHQIMVCHSPEAQERAKSLVNIEFSWYIVGVTSFAMVVYLAMQKMYPPVEKAEYRSVPKFELEDDSDDDGEDDVEAQKLKAKSQFLLVEKSFADVGSETNTGSNLA